jgi:hypothetical protein
MPTLCSGRCALAGMALLLVASCGTRNGKQGVEGNVTWKGDALTDGMIQFGETTTRAVIRNGKYSIPAENGLDPGTYTVRIYSAHYVDNTANPGKRRGPILRETIEELPACFNEETTLQAEIVGGRRNRFDFDLKE